MGGGAEAEARVGVCKADCGVCKADEGAGAGDSHAVRDREGKLPLTARGTAARRLCTAVASPEVQVVTHLCYSDFGDIMDAIIDMDGAARAGGEERGLQGGMPTSKPLSVSTPPARQAPPCVLCPTWAPYPTPYPS